MDSSQVIEPSGREERRLALLLALPCPDTQGRAMDCSIALCRPTGVPALGHCLSEGSYSLGQQEKRFSKIAVTPHTVVRESTVGDGDSRPAGLF